MVADAQITRAISIDMDAEKKRPVRGDNRTGQSHMGAWGDGRSRRI